MTSHRFRGERPKPSPFLKWDRPVIAWTGGSRPPPFERANDAQQNLVMALFWKQIEVYKAGWDGDEPPFDVLDIFFNRARHDAWATFRPHGLT